MSRAIRITLLLLVLAGAGAGGWFAWKWMHRPWRPMSPALIEPRLALAVLSGPSLYANAAGLAWLEREKRALLPAPVHRARLPQATQDPQLFRELDRELRFAEVWLVGDPSGFRPLLDHLLDTKDFTLAHLDHTSLVFRREGGGWSEAALDATLQAFSDPRERACAQAFAATRLIAVRQSEPALKLLKAAGAAGPDVPEVWSSWSTYWMSKGLWADAYTAAEKSLALDPEFLPGIACRAQCLYATRHFNAAWQDAEVLLAAHPDDPAMLFYHAKLAHEASAFQAEIASLRKLIALAEKAGATVCGYRVFLAQAYAKTGDADNAMDQVTLAMLDPALPREQRKFADELLQQIKRALDGK